MVSLHATSGSDGFPAIEDVLENGYMHRDVSEGNVVLFRPDVGCDRRGYLVDWEYASKVCEDDPREASDSCSTVRFELNHKSQ